MVDYSASHGESSGYHIADIYQGGYSSLDPEKSGATFTGYRTPVSKLGVSTDPRTANILKEVSEKIAPGQKVIELSLIDLGSPIEAIPKQHFDEIKRLSKLTGVEVTVHGPITDASGVVEGRAFDEGRRQQVERKLLQALEKAHQINPDGNIPVTFHTSNQLPGPTWEKNEKGEMITAVMPIVNRETGQINQVKAETEYCPELDKQGQIVSKYHDVDKKLSIMNNTEWDNSLRQLIVPKEHADRILRETFPLVRDVLPLLQEGKIKPEHLTETQKAYFSRFSNAHEQLEEVQMHLTNIFDKAYKAYLAEKNERGENYLKRIAEDFRENAKKGDMMSHSNALQGFMEELRPEKLIQEHIGIPKAYVPTEDYALEKTAESYGNVALEAYKKFGYKKEKDTTPLILIENPPAGGGLSTGEALSKLVKKSKENFIEKAKEKLGMSEAEAKKRAEELIGVTWDVGHINQMRRFGFEGKDIIKQAEIVAPLVKHVHLSDNFGLDNVELPMGMGNVDFKEVMQKLGVNGEKARKIVEAAHWWQFQQTSPVGVSMEALGSPIYAMKQAPYWNQREGFWQGYNSGFEGNWLPQINYETFGGGFSNLPKEIGGQRGQTGRSRMSGTPME